jgi:hypothetical protein
VEVLGAVTNTQLQGAVGFGIAACSALVPFHLILKNHRHRLLLLAVSFVGIIVAMVGIAIESTVCFVLGSAIFFFTVIAAIVILATEPIPKKSLAGRRLADAIRGQRKGIAFLVGMAVVVLCAGVGIGLLVSDSGSSADAKAPPTAVAGKYHVSGTCANGSCTLNECVHRAACGSENEGRLREGAPLDIVCQAGGKVVEAPNGRKSRVWDRLSDSLYVSDLFVSGTRVGRFAPGLPRCTGG